MLTGTATILGTATINGIKAIIIPADQYAGVPDDVPLPPDPPADANGNVPAAEFMQASIARRIIIGRKKMGLTQEELARRAGVRQETISRIESGKFGVRGSTLNKIADVIEPEHAPKAKRIKK